MLPDEYVDRLPELLARLRSSLSGAGIGNATLSGSSSRTSAGAATGPSTGSGLQPDCLHVPEKKLDQALDTLIERLSRHYPFHEPFYAGQMLKPPHPAAWLAYALAMTINPNNHALDGGPESSFMEKEAIQLLVQMTGFPDQALGHLTSSGTIANLEALWVARELHPDRPITVSSQAHYTHQRMGQVLRHPVVTLPVDGDGLPDPSRLDSDGPLPGTVVVTLGTTGQGRVEPLHRILPWARKHRVRIHVDAAYGGFFHLIRGTGLIDPEPWMALGDADSIVIDPHKHGLQPYGCGAVLFRDPAVGRFYRHDSPYTYFTSGDLHLGEISLECSRAGSSAIALWFTLQLLLPKTVLRSLSGTQPGASGLTAAEGAEGAEEATKAAGVSAFPQILMDCRLAALKLYDALEASDRYHPVMRPELDIVTWIPVTRVKSYSAVSKKTEQILRRGMDAGEQDRKLFLSTLSLARNDAARLLPELEADQKDVKVLRSVMMKPEHLGFVPEMMHRLHKLHDIRD